MRVLILSAFSYVKKGTQDITSMCSYALPRQRGGGLDAATCRVKTSVVEQLEGQTPCMADVEMGAGGVFQGSASATITKVLKTEPMKLTF